MNWLWVALPYRKQGIGSELMAGAERAAREQGCRAAYLDTFTFQAPKFYERLGYWEFGRLNDFPPGHARIWFSKALSELESAAKRMHSEGVIARTPRSKSPGGRGDPGPPPLKPA